MVRLKQPIQRRFHVLILCGEVMEAPKGLILFANTPLGKELESTELKSKFGLGIILSALILTGLVWFVNILAVVCLILVVNSILIWSAKQVVKIPLAVNLNHPFMESEYVSNSEVMVNFSGKWIDPGNHRLKLARDNLGGWIVHRQDDDLTTLAVWDSSLKESTLQKYIAIINQAISLNNAINESTDEFSDARERESQESTLLERNWLPEEELDVQGPISRIFSNE